MAKHPAVYSDRLLHLFAEALRGVPVVLDPMGGTGKLALVKHHGYSGRVVVNELEAEFANGYAVDEWHIADAADMRWAPDASFPAICTSPAYGNRCADHHNARDRSRRITYKECLGRDPSAESTAVMQWGEAYRLKHRQIYAECLRVLAPGGLLVLNMKDHIRRKRRQYVSKWHLDTLRGMGLHLAKCSAVRLRGMGFGANRHARCPVEYVFVFEKPRSAFS